MMVNSVDLALKLALLVIDLTTHNLGDDLATVGVQGGDMVGLRSLRCSLPFAWVCLYSIRTISLVILIVFLRQFPHEL